MDRPFEELRGSGLLWLINRAVFHPRGYALALTVADDGKATGWSLLGDGSEPWQYGKVDVENDKFRRAEATLRDNAGGAVGQKAATPLVDPDGTLQISLSLDGAVVLGQADQSIAVSVHLLRQLEGPDSGGCATRRDGLIIFAGVDPDGKPLEVAYRQVGFNPTTDPDANEGGFLLLERVS